MRKRGNSTRRRDICFENQIMESEEREWVGKSLGSTSICSYAHISDYIWWCQWEDAMNYYFKVLSDTKGSAWKKFQWGPPFFSSPPNNEFEMRSCRVAVWDRQPDMPYKTCLLISAARFWYGKREKLNFWALEVKFSMRIFRLSRRERLPTFHSEKNYPNNQFFYHRMKSLPFLRVLFLFFVPIKQKT